MSEGSSRNNQFLFVRIIESLKELLVKETEVSIEEFLWNYSGAPDASENEITGAINWAVENGYILLKINNPYYKSILTLSNINIIHYKSDFQLVISIPKNMELGLARVLSRNYMIETRTAFRKIFTEAKKILRISSPFFERSILKTEGLPDIEDYLKFAFERGCSIQILTRKEKRENFQWLRKLAEINNCTDSLHIFEYHHEYSGNRVWSSIHSKIIIADTSYAYVGSAEIRKNSLDNNFEAGCLIEGPSVIGLCEAFDCMLLYSTEVY